jgi:NAD(P)-dependent dehydrogenase (short-subunit alcohol dehydrogenase family)
MLWFDIDKYATLTDGRRHMVRDLTDKVAMVTGGSRGIGAAIAARLAAEGADMGALTILGRIGTTADIAAAVAFLVGPDAGYLTGTRLTVDGGLQTP